jgi:hypothetical protein
MVPVYLRLKNCIVDHYLFISPPIVLLTQKVNNTIITYLLQPIKGLIDNANLITYNMYIPKFINP